MVVGARVRGGLLGCRGRVGESSHQPSSSSSGVSIPAAPCLSALSLTQLDAGGRLLACVLQAPLGKRCLHVSHRQQLSCRRCRWRRRKHLRRPRPT